MFGGRVLGLGRLYGIRIGVDPSWFILFFLITSSLADGFAEKYSLWSPMEVWGAASSASIFFFLSILLHELGHSITARLLGIEVRSITLFLFGGAAELSSEPRRPRDEFLIAIAGPGVSGLIGMAALVLWATGADDTPLKVVSLWLGVTNVGIAIFNMFPGFPLDGGRVLRAALWHFTGDLDRATQWSGRVGALFGRLMIGLGIALAIITEEWGFGLFMALLGWFLTRAAFATVQQSQIASRLRTLKAKDAVVPVSSEVDGWDTLEDILAGPFAEADNQLVIVTENDSKVGVLGAREVGKVPINKLAYQVARQLMTPLARLKKIDVRESLLTALRVLDSEDVNQLLVESEGEFFGILTRDQLKRALS
ncbi:MAG: Zn-dependent protease [Planctomycetota bacterium]|jgi:Zn-dependent protease